jgi:alkylation response protein AidB-like acyl-CoA dehydrogenase
MEVILDKDLKEFRAELRSWIESNTPPGLVELFDWNNSMTRRGQEGVRAAQSSPLYKEWESRLLEAHLICAHWPVEVGGRGLSAIELSILGEEFYRAGVPLINRVMGELLVGPSIIVHGTEEQKAYFLPRIIDGTDVYCQGFSEPNHGSDLAAVETKGVVDGDEVVVTGQKVWTSLDANATNMMFCLCRTDESQPRHRGLSYVLLPFRNNGIEVRPIRQMTGGSHFCEEFIDGARAPLFNVIGGLGNGWRVAMTTLGDERGGGATVMQSPYAQEFWDLVDEVRRSGKVNDPFVRQQLAWSYENVEILRVSGVEMKTTLTLRRSPGPGVLVNKLRSTEYHRKFAQMVMAILGPEALIRPRGEGYDISPWQDIFLRTPAQTIAGGSSQIQRNIISERALGMPKEPKPASK